MKSIILLQICMFCVFICSTEAKENEKTRLSYLQRFIRYVKSFHLISKRKKSGGVRAYKMNAQSVSLAWGEGECENDNNISFSFLNRYNNKTTDFDYQIYDHRNTTIKITTVHKYRLRLTMRLACKNGNIEESQTWVYLELSRLRPPEVEIADYDDITISLLFKKIDFNEEKSIFTSIKIMVDTLPNDYNKSKEQDVFPTNEARYVADLYENRNQLFVLGNPKKYNQKYEDNVPNTPLTPNTTYWIHFGANTQVYFKRNPSTSWDCIIQRTLGPIYRPPPPKEEDSPSLIPILAFAGILIALFFMAVNVLLLLKKPHAPQATETIVKMVYRTQPQEVADEVGDGRISVATGENPKSIRRSKSSSVWMKLDNLLTAPWSREK